MGGEGRRRTPKQNWVRTGGVGVVAYVGVGTIIVKPLGLVTISVVPVGVDNISVVTVGVVNGGKRNYQHKKKNRTKN